MNPARVSRTLHSRTLRASNQMAPFPLDLLDCNFTFDFSNKLSFLSKVREKGIPLCGYPTHFIKSELALFSIVIKI